jgi:hypothetical protein
MTTIHLRGILIYLGPKAAVGAGSWLPFLRFVNSSAWMGWILGPSVTGSNPVRPASGIGGSARERRALRTFGLTSALKQRQCATQPIASLRLRPWLGRWTAPPEHRPHDWQPPQFVAR